MEQGGQRGERIGRGWLAFWVILGALILWQLSRVGETQNRIPFSQFSELVESNQLARVVFRGREARGELRPGAPPFESAPARGGEAVRTFVTTLPAFGTDDLPEKLLERGVLIDVEPEPDAGWGTLLIGLLPFLLLIGIVYLLYRGARQRDEGLFSVMRSRAKLYDESIEKVTMDDVAGAYEAKEELAEIIALMRNPSKFHAMGAKPPKGVLLTGPPGTGKTLLARAVAGEAGVPFFSITGSDFMQMFVGVGAARVRDMFKRAKERAPAIIFIDELDSVGRQRGAGLGGGHDEREQTLNQLLSELDGFEPTQNLVVIAATNRPDILDPALLRPGRFDRKIPTELPPLRARVEILKVHARGKPLADDVDLELVARRMPGASGADLAQVLNEAAMLAVRAGKTIIEWEDVEKAQDKVVLGLRRRGLEISEEEREVLAYHEAGHAVLSAILPRADPVQKVSILPRGMTMGVTHQLPEREMYVYPQEYMFDRLTILMGGRAAEEIRFGMPSTGAANDYQVATRLARRMVLEWGMNRRFGPLVSEHHEAVFLGRELGQGREFSEETSREADLDIRDWLESARRRAHEELNKHRSRLDALAMALLEKEELGREDVMRIVRLGVFRTA